MVIRGLVCFLIVWTARAADLTGLWILRVPTGDGNNRETVFQLTQDGTKLTGTAQLTWGKLDLLSGSVIGATVKFALQFGDPPIRESYTGVLKHDTLQLQWGIVGRPLQKGSAMRTTEAALTPPAKIPAPIIRTLPDNGLARTPPMGWNSWNHFRGKVDDAAVRAVADAIASNGMLDAGYVYVVIDDTWEGERDHEGNLHPNRKFPDMKALADYVHSKGLMLGIYTTPGPKTCGGYAGSYGVEDRDARLFASWGIDYLKYDWCSAGQIYTDEETRGVFQRMGEAIQATGRPVVYSISNGGRAEVWKWGAAAGANLWRTRDDIRDNWASMSTIGFGQNGLEEFARWGHWNDPDVLEIGNGGMTAIEYKTHMTLWAMLAAPLMAGNDVRSMTPETAKILLNKEVIAIDQDSLGKQASRYVKSGEVEIWMRPLSDGSRAVAWFNRASHNAAVSFDLRDLGFAGNFVARDLWAQRDLKLKGTELDVSLQSHDCLLLRITALH